MRTPTKPTKAALATRPNAPVNADGFWTDGPTLKQYIAAGYTEASYPPAGFAVREDGEAQVAPAAIQTGLEKEVGVVIAGAKKFYHALNSNRYIISKGLQFAFAPYEHVGGTWMGIYATDIAKEIEALDELVTGKKSAVSELTEEEYNAAVKKKADGAQGLSQSLLTSDTRNSSSEHPSANTAALLNSEPEPEQVPSQPIVTSEADLKTGKIEAPKPSEAGAG